MPRISALPELAVPADDDLLVINDDSASTTKKMTIANFKLYLQSLVGFVTTGMLADNSATSEKLKSTIAFKAWLGTNQSAPAGVTELVEFDTIAYDFDDNFDDTTHRFTAPKDGVYSFSTYVSQPDGGTPRCIVNLHVNGALAARLYDMHADTYRNAGGSTDLKLLEDDYVEVHFYSSLADTIVASETQTFFTGHLVGGTE